MGNAAVQRNRVIVVAKDVEKRDANATSATPLPTFVQATRSGPFTVSSIPPCVLTDSYKASHHRQYPPCKEMVAYGECRTSYPGVNDSRIVFYGIRYVVENYISRRWTMADVEISEAFYKTHCSGFSAFPYPRDLFIKFVKENNGHFPVRLEALPEGTVVYPHTPVLQISARGDYARLVTFLETLLCMVWYPTTVATLSRHTREIIERAFQKSVDPASHHMIESRLHDFGFRGCTSVEQSMIGGAAHLLNFNGSDCMSAAFFVQYGLNNGQPVAQSIPATEHSVMTAWQSEQDAMENMIEEFGDGVFACVMDSYDYNKALDEVLPLVAPKQQAKKGFMVLRPDSGDPVETVLLALRKAEQAFGSTTNSLGYKVINQAGVIQGDGINIEVVQRILNGVIEAGFSAQCVAFGMGSALIQKINRDTMSFAIKLSYIEYADGTSRDCMKTPKTSKDKFSLPGVLAVRRDHNGTPVVYPKNSVLGHGENLLKVVYDDGPMEGAFDDFATVRRRLDSEWRKMSSTGNPISSELQGKVDEILIARRGLPLRR